ncbi:MAG: hypothetical protein ACK46O_06135 [Flavobacteriia bacterium]|jgi:hypothetical protein
MDDEKNIHENIVLDPSSAAPMPRPIAPRKCACDCGILFQPGRKDQLYLNRQHANYGYNHGKRKITTRTRRKEEAILAKNDQILHKHFTSEKDLKMVLRYYEVLKADRFNFGYHIGQSEKNGISFWYTYRYFYVITQTEPKQVKIYKR